MSEPRSSLIAVRLGEFRDELACAIDDVQKIQERVDSLDSFSEATYRRKLGEAWRLLIDVRDGVIQEMRDA